MTENMTAGRERFQKEISKTTVNQLPDRSNSDLSFPDYKFREAIHTPGKTYQITKDTYQHLTKDGRPIPNANEQIVNFVSEGCYRISWTKNNDFFTRVLTESESKKFQGLYIT